MYKKLVRDNIPDKIRRNNEEAITRVLDDNEFKIELEKKLKEECNEVISSSNSTDRIEELSDLIEVISTLAELENSNLDEVIKMSITKRNKLGGFSNKIYLEDVK